MRIAPHVLIEPDLSLALARVMRDGVLTHGHPRALVGALVFAAALHTAFRQGSTLDYGALLDAAGRGLLTFDAVEEHLPSDWPDDLHAQCRRNWPDVLDEVEVLLSRARASLEQGAMSSPDKLLAELGSTDPKVNGAGTVTAVGAVYLASRFAARPMGAMLQAAFLRRGDTDTLASMTASLLGAVHGTGWLEGLDAAVQDSTYIRWLSTGLVGGRPTPLTPLPQTSPADLRRQLESTLLVLAQRPRTDTEHGVFPDGRTWTLHGLRRLPDSDDSRATLKLEDGQTVFIDVTASPSEPASDNGNSRADQAGSRATPDTQRQPGLQLQDDTGAVVRLGITLPTRDLRRTATFYAALLGWPVPIIKDSVHVTEWLTLRHGEAIHQATDSILCFAVDDVRAAAQRLGIEQADDVVRGRDPDGRRVEIRAVAVPRSR
jgi:hypothetical protein